MNEQNSLAARFEANRSHLRQVAYRMLGSLSEADDAVQEAWLRLSRTDVTGVENLGGWLTTTVSRVCLDALRARKARRDEPVGADAPAPAAGEETARDPEQEALLADSVGLALLVVLDTLAPAERLAFVLHDMFDLSFDEIASIVGRSPVSARQLASRARRRVQGAPKRSETDLHWQRPIVDAFLAALREGDFDGLLAVLDPEVIVRAELPGGMAREVRGAATWAKGATGFRQLAQFVRPALVDGAPGAVFAPRGRMTRALRFTIVDGKIVSFDVIMDPEKLRQLSVAVLGDS